MSSQEFTQAEYIKLAMSQGMDLRHQGKHLEAAKKFDDVQYFALDDKQRSLAAEARGIALRLAGSEYAMFSFTKALQFSHDDPERLGVIMREFAILRLDEGKIDEAQNMLSKALWHHQVADDKLERAITLGLLGQALWLNTEFDTALDCFAECRFRYLPRTLWLALKTGRHYRLTEAVLIAIDPDFAERIKRRRQGH